LHHWHAAIPAAANKKNKMKLYIYNVETLVVVAIINGETNTLCESANLYDSDMYGATYTPAFGLNGLVGNDQAEMIEA
jgi:hypothetical protein